MPYDNIKVIKSQGFTLSLKDTFFKKPRGEGGQFDPPPPIPQPFLGEKQYLGFYQANPK